MPRRGAALVALFGVSLAGVACSPATPDAPLGDANLDTATTCDRTLPDCPAKPPSYSGQVGAIFTDRCVGCHYTGSKIARTDLSSYAKIHAVRGSVLTQVFGCLMPSDEPLQTAQRRAILEWLACGAPDD